MFLKKNESPDNSGQDNNSFNPAWAYTLIGIVILTAAYRYALPTRDGDIWFHLAYAKYFLMNHTIIPDHTVFSWTPAVNDTIYCAWLSELFFYGLYKLSGLPGLFAFRYLVIYFVVFLCYYFAKKNKVHHHPFTWLACLLAVLLSYTGIFEKPTIFSYLFFTLYCYIWWNIRTDEMKSWKAVYLFPLIMLIWVNSHGAFLFGCIFLMVINAGEFLNTWLSPDNRLSLTTKKHLFSASVLAAVAVFLTPYGIDYPFSLIQDNFSSNSTALISNVAEYVSPFTKKDTYGFVLCANIAVLLLLIQLVRSFKNIEWSLLLLNIVFLVLYAAFFRTTFFWPVIFLFSTIYLLSQNKVEIRHTLYTRLKNATPLGTFILCAFICLFFLYRSFATPGLHQYMGFGFGIPTSADEINYIEQHYPDVKIGNTYNQGAFLIWKLWPDNRIFVDARYFPFKDWIHDAFSFNKNGQENTFLKNHKADIWLIDFTDLDVLHWFKSSPDWQLEYYGTSAALYVRKKRFPEVKKYTRSIKLDQQMNQANSIYNLMFALDIHDWEGSDIILESLKEKYSYFPVQKKITKGCELYTKAAIAFDKKDYAAVVSSLDTPESIAITNDRMLALSLIHLSIHAWLHDDRTRAKRLNRKAYTVLPHYTSVFNAAMMNWIEYNETGFTEMELFEKKKLWQDQFSQFITETPETSLTSPFRAIAQKILNDSYTGSPTFFEPANE